MINFYPVCDDCKTNKYVIEDTINGRYTCSQCGIVTCNTLLYEHSEWRDFNDNKLSNRNDPNRIGSIFDPLLSDTANLTTFIGNGENENKLQKLNQMNNNNLTDKKKNKTSILVSNFGSRLSLSKNIKLICRQLVNQILDSGKLSGKNLKQLVASCLYISAKSCHSPKPLKEICSIMDVRRRDIAKIFSEIQKLKSEGIININNYNACNENKYTDGVLFAIKWANILELPPRCIQAIAVTGKNLKRLDIMNSSNPSTVAACLIWACISLYPNDTKIQRDAELVAKICQISLHNFKTQYRKYIQPRLLDLIPENYANQKYIINLMNN